MAAKQKLLPKKAPSQGAILFSMDADTQDSRTIIVKKRLEQQANHMTSAVLAGLIKIYINEGSYSQYLINNTKQKSW